MASNISGIYIILNTKNGKVYVGQATDFHARWENHRRSLEGDYHGNRHLQAAWNKYGAKSFKFLKLEYCSIDQLNEREQHHITIYMERGVCYNIAKDANAPMRGLHHSKETRHKIGEGNKGKVVSEETCRKLSEIAKCRSPLSEETKRRIGEASKGNKHNLGRVASEETRRKLSLVHQGRFHSEESRHKMSEIAKNRPPPSEETRAKISTANKGKKRSEEERLKISLAIKGKPKSEDHKRKIGEANKGRVHSEETRLKLSESAILRHARKRAKFESPDILPPISPLVRQ